MNPTNETPPRAEVQKDRGASPNDAPQPQPSRAESAEAEQRFRDWALI